jgi:hypothetical protein
MLTAIHLLLTYACTLKCDHCFLFCSPSAKGTMTVAQIQALLDESKRLGSIEAIYFEGGEPFLFYPVMVEGIRRARAMGFKAGIVSNGFWATSAEDATLWLRPLADLGLSDLSVSDDELHFGDAEDTPSKFALAAAKLLGIPTGALRKTKPVVTLSAEPAQGAGRESVAGETPAPQAGETPAPQAGETPAPQAGETPAPQRGKPEISGGIKMRGRAAEKFVEGLPTRCCGDLGGCPFEDLVDPKRVHIDSFGNVQICQGINMGNCWKTPLSELARRYDAQTHPICGPLVRGGPNALAQEYGLKMGQAYVSECHLCYSARLALLDRFPEVLAPRQAYGLGPG